MKGIMMQGTSSNVGKSILTTGLCRLFANKGYSVAPFKAQNMSDRTCLIQDGKEMSIAQVQQAEAANLVPSVRMNPVLLKPNESGQTEVVLLGEKVMGEGADKISDYASIKQTIHTALTNLRHNHALLLLEGAGSPVEMNLKSQDLANMSVAEMADVPVVLVADIDRGGAFASIVGTLELLTKEERQRVKGLIINKFRGDISSFTSGVQWLESYTGLPVLGVVPHIAHGIAEEDSLSESNAAGKSTAPASSTSRDADYERLSQHLEKYVDVDKLQSIILGEAYED